MKITFINDWKYLFKPWALGGRLAAFTFFNLSYMSRKLYQDEIMLGGVSITVLGIGIRFH